MRRFLPFAALLGVALVLGCQDLGSVGPDGLEPQFAKPGACEPPDDPPHPSCGGDEDGGDNLGSPVYTYTFFGPDDPDDPSGEIPPPGDIMTDPRTAIGAPGGNNQGDVGLQGCCGHSADEELILTNNLLVDPVGGGASTCFGGSENLTLVTFLGGLNPDKKNMNEVEARFLFDAKV